MKIDATILKGVFVIEPQRFFDDRGFFSEVWNKGRMEELGMGYDWVQDNHSLSLQNNTLRGLHFQRPPHAQAKLVRCVRGCVFDVAVDIRVGSETYGQWVGKELSCENGLQLLIPAGFLHGYITRAANTQVIYKCSDYYATECEFEIRYNCPLIGIDWGLKGTKPAISNKDKSAPTLEKFHSPFVSDL